MSFTSLLNIHLITIVKACGLLIDSDVSEESTMVNVYVPPKRC